MESAERKRFLALFESDMKTEIRDITVMLCLTRLTWQMR